MSNKVTLDNIIPQLITQGENPKELNLWLKIFRDLSSASQEELAKNLEAELKSLAGNV